MVPLATADTTDQELDADAFSTNATVAPPCNVANEENVPLNNAQGTDK